MTDATHAKFKVSALKEWVTAACGRQSPLFVLSARCDAVEQREHSRCGLTVAAGANLPDLVPSWRAATFDTRAAEQRAATLSGARAHMHTHVDDDNHGKTDGCQRTRVHRNSEREDVNGETGRNTRRRPKITESSCVAVVVTANVCTIRGRHCCERTVWKRRSIWHLCDSCAITSTSIIRDTAKLIVVVVEIGNPSRTISLHGARGWRPEECRP